jgi:hypothetical protein
VGAGVVALLIVLATLGYVWVVRRKPPAGPLAQPRPRSLNTFAVTEAVPGRPFLIEGPGWDFDSQAILDAVEPVGMDRGLRLVGSWVLDPLQHSPYGASNDIPADLRPFLRPLRGAGVVRFTVTQLAFVADEPGTYRVKRLLVRYHIGGTRYEALWNIGLVLRLRSPP